MRIVSFSWPRPRHLTERGDASFQTLHSDSFQNIELFVSLVLIRDNKTPILISQGRILYIIQKIIFKLDLILEKWLFEAINEKAGKVYDSEHFYLTLMVSSLSQVDAQWPTNIRLIIHCPLLLLVSDFKTPQSIICDEENDLLLSFSQTQHFPDTFLHCLRLCNICECLCWSESKAAEIFFFSSRVSC